jgi:hypothetical protein
MKTFNSLTILILTFGLEISTLLAQQAKNVNLADFISTEELYGISSFPYNTFDFPLADVWGWTYNGNEYALVCLGSKNVNGTGLAMVDTTDSKNAAIIKTIQTI